MKNHSDELIFHSQGLRRNAANLGIASEKSPSRISPRGLSAKRFDMEEKKNSALEKLLLSELRIVVYEPGPAPGSPEHAPAPGSAEASSDHGKFTSINEE